MQSHEEIFRALLAGETLMSSAKGTNRYKLIEGRIYYQNTKEETAWCKCNEMPNFDAVEIVPRTININGHEFPEPLRVAPKEGTPVFIPAFDEDLFSEYTYLHAGISYDFLKHGVLHLSPEAAIAHAKALLSFTKK